MSLRQRVDEARAMGDSGTKPAPDAPAAIATDRIGVAFDRGGRIRQPLLSSSRVGSTNKGLVIQALFDLGPTSRAALARIADVNRTTISGIVQPLIDAGWLVEGNPIRATRAGGKPAKPLWFSPDAQP